MIEKFEKITKTNELDVSGQSVEVITIEAVEEKDATHKHICYHDETPFKPCVREEIKT